MKTKYVISLMVAIWLILMANILWQGTNGKWYVEDAEKIGNLEVAKYTNQIIVVGVGKEETILCMYEKKTTEGWKLMLETQALIGENGLGKTREGDKKTPAGTFHFTNAFGILESPGTKLDYLQVNENHYWVDDGNSRYYNQLVSINEVPCDWRSAEHICKYEEAYAYVLATSYNMERIPGAGSAVFLHCTSSNMEATAGCIAVPETYMKQIMIQVDPQCVLIIDEEENILHC